jgi:hypothetical protein
VQTSEVRVARYRLRFLLQEFDLPRGITLIGRSLDCQVTIEDPLVSRQHARIVIDDDGPRIEDLGSRNGVKLNGVTIRQTNALKDGDRLRIGTQDLVFCRVEPVDAAHAKTTGVLRLCANCRLPYPREMPACPNCEATEQMDEETLSGSFGAEKQRSWSVQLLVEALERALLLDRVVDADRLVRRATTQIEELAVAGSEVDAAQLASVADAAMRTSLAGDDPTWSIWSADVYRRLGFVPPKPVLDRLLEVSEKFAGQLNGPVAALAERLGQPGTAVSPEHAEAIARLEQLKRILSGALGSGGGASGESPSTPTLS